MHVVIITDFAEVNGGAANVAIVSARGIAERGVRVTYVHGMPAVDASLQHPNITPVCLGLTNVWDEPPFRAALQAVWNFEAEQRISAILKRFDRGDTVVHFHQWTKTLSPSAIRAVGRAGFHHVITMHDYALGCPNGAYFNYAKNVPCNLEPMSLGCMTTQCDVRGWSHKLVRVARQLSTNATVGTAGSLLSVVHVTPFSAEISGALLPRGIRQGVVGNPIIATRAAAIEVRRNKHFVYLGRFTKEKGPALLARAASEGGHSAAFMGSGYDEGTIRKANPGALVLSWGSTADVARFLATARCLVFPSLWYECHGLVVAEALSRGIPVIVSRTTGVRDLIQDGLNGLVVDPRSRSDLLRCLDTLADDARVEAMGKNAYEMYWRNPPSVDSHVDSILRIYQEILASSLGVTDARLGLRKPSRASSS
jgi:glycosyltransferase involved in cell wall biosynthesis